MNIFNWFSKPKTWFVSDLHFSHKRVIEYCNRPFKDVTEMNELLIKEWNSIVRKKDKVYMLGDFSLNPNVSKKIAPLLNGYKILIAGNHDSCHISHNKQRMIEKYLNDWQEVHPENLFITLKNGMDIQLCHLPYAPEQVENLDMRYLNLRPKKETEFLLHGHTHGNYIKYKNQIDVGWDAKNEEFNSFKSEDDIIKIINDPRDFIPSHLTEFFKNRDRKIKE